MNDRLCKVLHDMILVQSYRSLVVRLLFLKLKPFLNKSLQTICTSDIIQT